jgi:AraC family transcriptional regulator, transcriptional activator FtrA
MRDDAAMTRRHRVAVLAPPDAALFEVSVACEIFGEDLSELGVPWYRFRLAGVTEGPVRTTTPGVTLHATYGLDALRWADTVVVAPGSRDEHPPELLEELSAAHRRGARLVSLCTGAFVLAAAGVLDGRRATTHWLRAAELAERHPSVRVDPAVLYVDDGDVLTSAGTAASIDLCLHLVRSDFGAEVANALARRLVVPPHRDGGQAQYIDHPLPDPGPDLFGETLHWMQAHLGEELAVDDLARRAAMSPRTFARRFRLATGTTPLQWLLHQRVLLARQMLETTDLPVERIAERCGFGTAATLRQHFQRMVHTTPRAYRRTFRQDLAG